MESVTAETECATAFNLASKHLRSTCQMKETTRHQENGALCDCRKRSSEQERELNKEARHVQWKHLQFHRCPAFDTSLSHVRIRSTCVKSEDTTVLFPLVKKSWN